MKKAARRCWSCSWRRRPGKDYRPPGADGAQSAHDCECGSVAHAQALSVGDSGIAGEFITIARVLGPQGRRGEVLAELHTDFPERFEERRQLSGLAADGSRRELQLEEHWFHKGGVVLKFAGVESISDAEQLAGLELQVPREERTELEAGAAYVSEIVGCEVWIRERRRAALAGTVKRSAVRGGRGSAAGSVQPLPAKIGRVKASRSFWCRTRKSF